ncbi:hypothetical protein M1P56_02150 [Streptomyces sp. HU2014]|uniref:DUF6879 domain-containing protein n=1 Tax=Streptomyces albireticuli TaxID=1940 RepID=A0A1Z2L5U0_9ACTN|nr:MULTISPECIES: DUF6879 family protein [Streptomyces]ARZ69653.1 hypothetical protein SMD11_4040 [Streptomyces albireticuli]UQI43268.1 hypothetical protein M1P56_02150 [Streptomyces sp. HU2014]
MLLAGEEWNRCFDSMRSEAWRLETLPVYTMPQEAEKMDRFLAGEKSPDDYWSSWMGEVREWRKEGKRAGRVHIVTRPLSEYLRFEFEYYYRHHVKAGEDIRILDVTERENPLPGVRDFWMFDRSKVVLMNYRPDGTQISRELHDGDVSRFVEYQRIAVSESIPFLEYTGG